MTSTSCSWSMSLDAEFLNFPSDFQFFTVFFDVSQFAFLPSQFSSFQVFFQCSHASVRKFFISSFFSFLEVLRFDCRVPPSFLQFFTFSHVCLSFQRQWWWCCLFGGGTKAPSLDPSSCFSHHRALFFLAVFPSTCMFGGYHHWNCFWYPPVSSPSTLSTTRSSFSGSSLSLPVFKKFGVSIVTFFQFSMRSSLSSFLISSSFLRFFVFGPVGLGSTPFRLSGAFGFPLQFSFFIFVVSALLAISFRSL